MFVFCTIVLNYWTLLKENLVIFCIILFVLKVFGASIFCLTMYIIYMYTFVHGRLVKYMLFVGKVQILNENVCLFESVHLV